MKLLIITALLGISALGQPAGGRGQLLGLSGSALEQVMGRFPKAASGTATVSFTLQGRLPWLPPGVDTYYLMICGPAGTSIPAGSIYQTASEKKMTPLSPDTVKSLLYRKQSSSKLGWTISLARDAVTTIPMLGAANVISMNVPWVVGLLAANPTINKIENQLQAQIPDPTPTVNLLLDPGAVLLFTGPCFQATIGAGHHKRMPSGTFVIQ